jgi:hypothetical protein
MSRAIERLSDRLYEIHLSPRPAGGFAVSREFLEDLLATLLELDRRVQHLEGAKE